MFKSGARVSNRKLSDNSFSGAPTSGSGNIPSLNPPGGTIPVRALGVLDAWGQYGRAALYYAANPSAISQQSALTCDNGTVSDSCCGPCNSYGVCPSCPIPYYTPLAQYKMTQYAWSGSATRCLDFAVAGSGENNVQYGPCNSYCGPAFTYTGYPSTAYAIIKDDSTLWIWGYGSLGALGDSTTTTSRSSPVQVGTGWDKIVGGNGHFLATKNNADLFTWGLNNFGQLGDNSTANRSSPVNIAGSWVDISTGAVHSAGIKTDGTLWTWGINNVGQLGDGTTTGRSSPVNISGTWTRVYCGYSSTFALKSDNTLWAWGYNNNGQLGDGTTTNRSSPVNIAGEWLNVQSANDEYTHGIKTDGTLWAWGVQGLNPSIVSSPVQVGSSSYHRILPYGWYSGLSRAPNYSQNGYVDLYPYIDATGCINGYTAGGSTAIPTSNIYAGGGAKKIIPQGLANTWIIKDYIAIQSGSTTISGSGGYVYSGGTAEGGWGNTGAISDFKRNPQYSPTPHSVIFDSPGDYVVSVPPYMTRMHVLCVGGGGSGGSGNPGAYGGGGGGGALAWRNDIVVTPGDQIEVKVGAGGNSVGYGDVGMVGNGGGSSYIVYKGTTYAGAYGGSGGSATGGAGGGGGTTFGTITGGGSGGAGGGGNGVVGGGGGGAGGYGGTGGAGANAFGSTGSGGGGGAGGGGGREAGGGGVGIDGVGNSGNGGTNQSGGQGGSGGVGGGGQGGNGGAYGGGGGSGFHPTITAGAGGAGAVKLLFYSGATGGYRTYPSASYRT